jgi:RNA polymerase sigma factor (sigma-70 family)
MARVATTRSESGRRAMHPRSGAGAARGPEVELGREYAALRPKLASWARRNLGLSAADFEDLHEEAWAEVVRRSRNGSEIRHLHSFLKGAIRNKWKMRLRSDRRHPTVSLDAAEAAWVDAATGDAVVSDQIELHEDLSLGLELLESIPNQRRRQVLRLLYVCGLEPAEVRQVMGVTERTYRRLLEQAKAEIGKKLELVIQGRWCAIQRPSLVAYARGTADERQLHDVRRHLRRCAPCRQTFAEMRRAYAADARRRSPQVARAPREAAVPGESSSCPARWQGGEGPPSGNFPETRSTHRRTWSCGKPPGIF